jgi:Family of unknown function (DUF6152)
MKYILAIAVALYAAGPAAAHHSFAMFDQQRVVVLEGTVEEFRWTNPHCFVVLNVDGDLWPIEMTTPKVLRAYGFTPDVLRPGMHVEITIHPLRDGRRGGHFIKATLPDAPEIKEIDPGGLLPGEWPPRTDGP